MQDEPTNQDTVTDTVKMNARSSETRTSNQYLVPGAIVIAGVLIAGAVFATADTREQAAQVAATGNEIKAQVDPVTEADHTYGSEKPDLYVIEYSDFQCPYCERFHTTMKKVVDEYDGRVAWVYRHLPLESIHPEARPAAIASECVASLGTNDQFWQFTDKIFENQRSMSKDTYVAIAGGLGIDAGAFTGCLSSDAMNAKVDKDMQNAIDLGGQGTPYNVILTRKGDMLTFSGALPESQVKVLIERALNTL